MHTSTCIYIHLHVHIYIYLGFTTYIYVCVWLNHEALRLVYSFVQPLLLKPETAGLKDTLPSLHSTSGLRIILS